MNRIYYEVSGGKGMVKIPLCISTQVETHTAHFKRALHNIFRDESVMHNTKHDDDDGLQKRKVKKES